MLHYVHVLEFQGFALKKFSGQFFTEHSNTFSVKIYYYREQSRAVELPEDFLQLSLWGQGNTATGARWEAAVCIKIGMFYTGKSYGCGLFGGVFCLLFNEYFSQSHELPCTEVLSPVNSKDLKCQFPHYSCLFTRKWLNRSLPGNQITSSCKTIRNQFSTNLLYGKPLANYNI